MREAANQDQRMRGQHDKMATPWFARLFPRPCLAFSPCHLPTFRPALRSRTDLGGILVKSASHHAVSLQEFLNPFIEGVSGLEAGVA